MKNRYWIVLAVLVVVIAMLGMNKPMVEEEVSLTEPIDKGESLKIAVVSDIHYLATSLRDDGEAFKLFNQTNDGRVLEYGTEIMEALISDLAEEEVDVLIVSGDLTTNGEKKSHEEMAEFFRRMEINGTRVYVIPGNHDILNPYALGFEDDRRYYVKNITPLEFETIYKEFGYDEAIMRDADTLSYIVEPSDDLKFLMLDTNMYDKNLILKQPMMSGKLSEDTLKWVSDLQSMDGSESIDIISVTHHNLIEHSEMFSQGFTIDNLKPTSEALMNLGIHMNLSGHIHIQDIAYSDTYDFYDVVTGSILVYPQKYGMIEREDGQYTYSTQWVDVEGYAFDQGLKDQNLLNFKAFSEERFSRKSVELIRDRLSDSYTQNEIKLLADTMSQLNVKYFAGYDAIDKDEIMSSEGFRLWEASEEGFLRTYIMTMILDQTDDNYLMIPAREQER